MRPTQAPTPQRVPPGAVAIVDATPVTKASFEHWLPIVERSQAVRGSAKARHHRAVRATVAFLVKAQRLQQEARAEGANESTVNRLAAQRAAGQRLESGMSRADAVLRARLDIIAEGLQERHSKAAAPITQAQVAAYYAAHRPSFRDPAVRETLMVVARDHASALRAKAALASGQSWAAVAKRWSQDSSALVGGAYNVVEGVQSPALVRAVFASRRGQLTGPVKAQPAAQPGVWEYYLFKVTGGHPGAAQPLSKVTAQIRQTLTEQAGKRALAAFTSAYERRWRARTLCAPGYLVSECRNHAAGRGAGAR